MENTNIPTNAIENLKALETCVEEMKKNSANYKPLPRQMVGYGIGNDPIGKDSDYWSPFDKENSIRRSIEDFKNTVVVVMQQKESLSDEQIKAVQDLTFQMIKYSIATFRLNDARQFTHLISSTELEGPNSTIPNKTETVKGYLEEILKTYRAQYMDTSSSSRRDRHEASNERYKIEKDVEALLSDVSRGKFGKEISDDKQLKSTLEYAFFGPRGKYSSYE